MLRRTTGSGRCRSAVHRRCAGPGRAGSAGRRGGEGPAASGPRQRATTASPRLARVGRAQPSNRVSAALDWGSRSARMAASTRSVAAKTLDTRVPLTGASGHHRLQPLRCLARSAGAEVQQPKRPAGDRRGWTEPSGEAMAECCRTSCDLTPHHGKLRRALRSVPSADR
jgi:hypothetical protein